MTIRRRRWPIFRCSWKARSITAAFTSPKSYGGSSYFIRREGGNWLVDSPKFLPQLVRKFEEWGGIAHIFLTHRDDVADAEPYARHFGSTRHIHRLELSSQPGAEHVFEGFEPVELAGGLVAIPTPGHTAGHFCLLLEDRYLFTGDHLWWDRDENRLGASRSYCWYSWEEQIESMRRLAELRFEWVLPDTERGCICRRRRCGAGDFPGAENGTKVPMSRLVRQARPNQVTLSALTKLSL